jgi:hypothetical protein
VGRLHREPIRYLEILVKYVAEMQSIIGDLLEVNRVESGKLTVQLEHVSVSDAVTDALNTLERTAREGGVTLIADLSSHLPALNADPVRLRQILIILIDNALKCTPRDGTVTVRAAGVEDTPRFVCFDVTDTGRGISAEATERIFERPDQASQMTDARRTGLGLGLYICKELVTLHGGTLSVTSQVGIGSTFSFTVPTLALGPVLAPLFANGAWPATEVALIVVDVVSVQAWTSAGPRHAAASRARDLVAGCIPPGRAVLLPLGPSASTGTRMIVAAFGSAAAASALADRIRAEFARDRERGPACAVTCTILDTVPAASNASVETTASRMATGLEEAVKAYMAKEARLAARADAELGVQLAAMGPDFIRRQRLKFSSLTAALDADDYGVLRTYGHNLKGTGGIYGYPVLSELASALEDAADARDPQGVRKYLAALDQALRSATV